VLLSRRFDLEAKSQYVLTSREPKLADMTRRWYRDWMPWIYAENILIRSDSEEDKDQFKVDRIKAIISKHEVLPKSFIHFEDNVAQARMIAERTGVTVFHLPYLDDVGALGDLDNVIEVPRVEGYPNLWPVYKMLFEKAEEP
jgi:hypothetical protein